MFGDVQRRRGKLRDRSGRMVGTLHWLRGRVQSDVVSAGVVEVGKVSCRPKFPDVSRAGVIAAQGVEDVSGSVSDEIGWAGCEKHLWVQTESGSKVQGVWTHK